MAGDPVGRASSAIPPHPPVQMPQHGAAASKAGAAPRAAAKLDPQSPLRGKIERGDVKKFDGLTAPFVKMTPEALKALFAGKKGSALNAKGEAVPVQLLKEAGEGKVTININSATAKVMHNEVMRDPKIVNRFLEKESLARRFGAKVVGFFRNIGAHLNISQGAASAHLEANIRKVDGRQQLSFQTKDTEKFTGNEETHRGMRMRRQEGHIRHMFRLFFGNLLGVVKTTQQVKEARLDEIRGEAQRMAVKMAWLTTAADTAEADEEFKTWMEADARTLTDTDFIGGLRALVEEVEGDSAAGNLKKAVDRAEQLIREKYDPNPPAGEGADAAGSSEGVLNQIGQAVREGAQAVKDFIAPDSPLQALTETERNDLQLAYSLLRRRDLNADLDLPDKDPLLQNAGAVYQKGAEFRERIADEIAQGKEAVALSRKNPVGGDPASQMKFIAGRAERLKKIAELKKQLDDPTGAFKRMREGRAVVRGMLPVLMLHTADEMRTFVKTTLSDEYLGWVNFDRTKTYYKQAADAIYEGLVQGASEALVSALEMNEADRLRENARSFVERFESDVAQLQDKIWKSDAAGIGESLVETSGVFLASSQAADLRRACKSEHAEAVKTLADLKARLQQGKAEHSLSPKVVETLEASIKQLEIENGKLEKSVDHLFGVLEPGGKLQKAIAATEQAMVKLVSADSLATADFSAKTLAQLRDQRARDIQALRTELAGVEGELTAGHAQMLSRAIDAVEKRLVAAETDLLDMHRAARRAATSTDGEELARMQAVVDRIAERLDQGSAEGGQLSRARPMPSDEADQAYRTGLGRLALALSAKLKSVRGLVTAYDNFRSEVGNANEFDLHAGEIAPTERIQIALGKLDTALRASQDASKAHAEAVKDCATAAGVQAQAVEAGYKQSTDGQAQAVRRAIVARGLGLRLRKEVDPQPSPGALDFLASYRNGPLLVSVREAVLAGGVESDPPGEVNRRFNELFGDLGLDSLKNDPEQVGRIAARLFGGRDRLSAGLAFIREAVDAPRRFQADSALRLAVLDPALDKARTNDRIVRLLKSSVPQADLGSNAGFLAALADYEKGLGGMPLPDVLQGLGAFASMEQAYEVLRSGVAPVDAEAARMEQAFDDLQTLADVLLGQQQAVDATRRQARVALDQLLVNLSGGSLATGDLGTEKLAEVVRKAVRLPDSAGEFRADSLAMTRLVNRVQSNSSAANQQEVLMREPLRRVGATVVPEVFQRFQQRIKNDADYREKMLWYGALMVTVDGVLRSDLGADQHKLIGANPIQHPALFSSNTWRRSLFDFKGKAPSEWSAEQLARAQAQKDQVASFFKDGTALTGEVLAIISARVQNDLRIPLEKRRDLILNMASGVALNPDDLKLVRATNQAYSTTAGILQRSRDRIRAFEQDFTQARGIAADYKYFDPNTLDFDSKLPERHKIIADKNPFKKHSRNPARDREEREARIETLKAQGISDAELKEFNRFFKDDNPNHFIQRLTGTPLKAEFAEGKTGMHQGLQMYQLMLHAKMAEVYARAGEDDRAAFRELSGLRDKLLSESTQLARTQALRAAILAEWAKTGRPFNQFASDLATKPHVISHLLTEQWQLNRVEVRKPDGSLDKTASEALQRQENLIIQQQVREALGQASENFEATLKQWTEDASAHQGKLRALQQDFDVKVQTLLAKLKTTAEDRERVRDERNEALQEQLESVRAQTGLKVERSRLSLRDRVFPMARQLVADHIAAIKAQHAEASGRLDALLARLEREFRFQEGASWQDISREGAEWIREAERVVSDVRRAANASEAQPVAAGDGLADLQRVVTDSLEAGASAGDEVATYMAAAEFEASFAREFNALLRIEADARSKSSIPRPRLLAEGAAQDLPALFKADSAWMEKDHSTTPLPQATLLAIDRLRQVVDQLEAKQSMTADETRRRDDARVLLGVLTGLKRVADAASKIQSDTALTEDALPYLRSLIDQELLAQLDQLEGLLKGKDFTGMKVRGGGLFGSAPESKVIESVRQGLAKDASNFIVRMQREVIALKGTLPGGAALERAQLEQQPAETGSPERSDPDAAIESFDFGERASPIDDISLYLPEYRELCERVLKEPGGEAALFQVQQLLLKGLASNDGTAQALADVRAILSALDGRVSPAAAGPDRVAPTLASFGLQVQRTLGDGNCYFNAIAAQVRESQDDVRQRVAQDMKAFVGQPRPTGIARTVSQIDVDRTLQDARYFGANAWGEDYHCAHVARVYKRPVVLFGNGRAELYQAGKEIEDLKAGVPLPQGAIVLVHNGGNHWEWAKPAAPAAAATGARQASAAGAISRK